jgi:hypothetical protein
MRDFSWRYFERTGEIDAYLLFKEHQTICGVIQPSEEGKSEAEVHTPSEV